MHFALHQRRDFAYFLFRLPPPSRRKFKAVVMPNKWSWLRRLLLNATKETGLEGGHVTAWLKLGYQSQMRPSFVLYLPLKSHRLRLCPELTALEILIGHRCQVLGNTISFIHFLSDTKTLTMIKSLLLYEHVFWTRPAVFPHRFLFKGTQPRLIGFVSLISAPSPYFQHGWGVLVAP